MPGKRELTGETVLLRFADTASPSRWVLRSPVERVGIVPRPEVIPVGGWVQVHITDHNTGVCPAFRVQAIYQDSGEPMGDPEVWVDSWSPFLPDLQQGKTDQSGRIMIYGSRPGDTVWVGKDTSSTAITVDCSEAAVWEQRATLEPVP